MRWLQAWRVALPVSLVFLGALYHNIQRSYITTSDADIVYVYEALLYNAGYPQNNFDHPGYIYFLVLGWWFRLLCAAQILPIADYTSMAAAPAAMVDVAYAKLVIAGRWLSVIVSGGFVVAVFTAVWRLSRNTVAATIAAVVFALSAGLAVQSNLLRNELPSALLTFLAFMSMVEAAQARAGRSDLWLLLTGLSAVLALSAKIQAIFVLLGLPILLGAFTSRQLADAPYADRDGHNAMAWFLVLLSLSLAAPVAMMVVQTIRFRGASAVYQPLIAIYIAGMMMLYAARLRLPAVRIVSGSAALAIGVAFGLLSLLIRHNAENIKAIVLLVEHMTVFSTLVADNTAGFSVGDLAGRLLGGVQATVASRLRLSYDSMEAHRILELIIAGAALVAAHVRRWRLAAQCALILGLVWAQETVFALRGMNPNYRIYLDPWLALAAGLVASSAFRRLACAKPWQKGTVAAVASILVLAFVRQAADERVVARQPAENACYQMSNVREPMVRHFSQYCTGRLAP